LDRASAHDLSDTASDEVSDDPFRSSSQASSASLLELPTNNNQPLQIPSNANNQLNTVKMSAIQDSGDKSEPIKVLFALHDGFDTLDFCGPLEIFSHARHEIKDPGKTFPSPVLSN
jgi:hypothetical protein